MDGVPEPLLPQPGEKTTAKRTADTNVQILATITSRVPYAGIAAFTRR